MTMQGAHSAKYFVNSYLESDLPSRLVKYRNAWNLDDEELPEPLKYYAYEPLAIDHWPSLITVAISMNGLTRSDYTKIFDPQFRVEYVMRTYIWVKADSSEECTFKRDRLSTVLRSSFLDSPSLNRCGEEANLEVMIDESTIREEYSDLTLLKGERVMAGSYISYNLVINEILTAPVINPALQEFQIDIENVKLDDPVLLDD
jgi:hypothetical protein